ncbi:MAG: hypothetical protein M1833_001613 [Piccolia ochrophora]|nr:MAG: hypothetical protein M1833_001613 [Piccolia ochrophora]
MKQNLDLNNLIKHMKQEHGFSARMESQKKSERPRVALHLPSIEDAGAERQGK